MEWIERGGESPTFVLTELGHIDENMIKSGIRMSGKDIGKRTKQSNKIYSNFNSFYSGLINLGKLCVNHTGNQFFQ